MAVRRCYLEWSARLTCSIATGWIQRVNRGLLTLGVSVVLATLLLVACGDPSPTATESIAQSPTAEGRSLRPREAAPVAVPASTATSAAAEETVVASGAAGFVQVATGENHTCALRGNGQVVCWGANDQGQLDAPADLRFRQIASGWRFSCGILTDSTLACWGRDSHKQADPPVGQLEAVDAGWDHACALSGTSAICWGRNANERATPPAGVEFTAIGAGAEHSCGLSTSGELVCWGKNENGQARSRQGPFRALAVGIAHTCVLRNDGKALCQGENAAGQSEPPETSFVELSAGSNHTCGTLASGHVECWGGARDESGNRPYGPRGQLSSVSAGWLTACATTRHGHVACWSTATRHPTPEPYSALTLADVSLGQMFSQPTEVFPWPDGGFAVAGQAGSLLLLTPEMSIQPLLDLTDIVSTSGEERGFLSAAIDPHFAEYKFLYLYYTIDDPKNQEQALARLTRMPVVDGRPVRDEELVILELPRGEDASGHYGAAIRFGNDGMLYLGIGDASCFDCAQRLDTLFGKVIRIDVREASINEPYRIPDDNPFVETDNARPEIWSYGVRNPWRMSFDPDDGSLWVGDVGQANFEEVSVIEAGTNHGWPIVEGLACFVVDSSTKKRYGIESGLPCADTESFTKPLITYEHTGQCAIVGGMVYRGNAMPWLRGTYFFGDFCSGQIWALEGNDTSGWRMIEIADLDKPLSSFGIDEDGEILVLTFGGPLLRLSEAESAHAQSVTHIPSATIVTVPPPADFPFSNPDS